jgi:GntR family transcriptional repressor for pyruvate dehydrogenase complex
MVKRIAAYQTVACAIQRAILSGEYRPGSRLPDEAELAARFEVGRSTVREALRLLGGRGYVRVRAGAGGGSFVSVGDPAIVGRGLADDLVFLMEGRKITAAESVEARELHETVSVRLAARRAGPADSERILDLADETAQLLETPKEFARADLAFHLAIAEATGNRVLGMWMATCGQVIEHAMSMALVSIETRRQVADQHRAIAEAIAGHHEVEAVELMADHLRHFSVDLARMFPVVDSGDGSDSHESVA